MKLTITQSFYSQWGHFTVGQATDQPDDVAAVMLAGYAEVKPDPPADPPAPTQ